MSDVIISVRNLSKQYRIGARENRAGTFVEAVRNMLMSPFANYRQIRNLTRGNFEEENLFWALNDVSFDVKQGEVLGIIGANGAGKSTLLKILSRISDPTRGEAVIKGRVSALLEVGTGFHPELTGRENVYMNGTIHGMTKKEIDQKFDEIVDFSGIEKHIDTPIKFFSSGMKVRLGFAVAAYLEPEILIIDEVLSVGDAEFQKKCLGKMNDISKKSGRTVLFVSHDLSAVNLICNRGILLLKGKVEKTGLMDEVIRDYYNKIRSPDSSSSAIGNAISAFDISLNQTMFKIFDRLVFSFTLRASEPFSIFGLALLLYNKENQRIAVADLNEPLSGRLKQDTYKFEFRIEELPLVPNDYSLGLTMSSSLFTGNAYNLVSFSVIENHENPLQYPVSSRGLVKLIHSSTVQ